MRVESGTAEFGGRFRLGNGIEIVDAETGEALECSSVAKVEPDDSISRLAIRLELVRPESPSGSAEEMIVEAGVWLNVDEAEALIETLRGAVEELRTGELERDTRRRLQDTRRRLQAARND